MLIFSAIGMATYLVTLVATIPAQVVAPGATGTIWRGAAPLDGGNMLRWSWAPLRSLIRFGFAADWTVTGPVSALAGRAVLRPGTVMLDDVSGAADGGVLRSAGASLPFACAVALQVDLAHVAIGGSNQGIVGTVRSDAGTCQAFDGGPPVEVRPLTLDARQIDGTSVVNIAPTGHSRTPFVIGGLSSAGHLQLLVTGEGANALPFAAPAGGMRVESDL